MGRRQGNKRGFTLVEMLVVLTVLLLAATAIAPSLVSMKQTSDRRETIAAIKRLAETARERAVSSGQTTQVIYDETTKQFQIEDVAQDGTTTQAQVIQLLAGIEPQKFQLAGQDSSSSDFKLMFTGDGHSNGGGVEFPDFSIAVDTYGISQFISGPLPDATDLLWQAGNLEQRN